MRSIPTVRRLDTRQRNAPLHRRSKAWPATSRFVPCTLDIRQPLHAGQCARHAALTGEHDNNQGMASAEAPAPSASPELPAVIHLPDLSQPATKRPVPWRGRPRVADPQSEIMPPWRVTPALRDKVLASAKAAGLSYGAFMRATLGGTPGPRARRQSPIDATALTKILAQLGKIGSNHNQLAHAFNANEEMPGRAAWERQEEDIQAMRQALLKALGYAD